MKFMQEMQIFPPKKFVMRTMYNMYPVLGVVKKKNKKSTPRQFVIYHTVQDTLRQKCHDSGYQTCQVFGPSPTFHRP